MITITLTTYLRKVYYTMMSTTNSSASIFTIMFNEKNIDILGTKEEPIFIVNQICELIELDKTAEIVRNVKEDKKTQVGDLPIFEKQLLRKKYPKGNLPSLINEYGLYEILFQSNKPIAKQFKHHIYLLLKDIRLGNIKLAATENSLLKQELEKHKKEIDSLNTISLIQKEKIQILGDENTDLKEEKKTLQNEIEHMKEMKR